MTTTINASNSGSGGLVQTADASGILALQTAGTTAVTIDASQRVGIGTTSPGANLEVKGSSGQNIYVSYTSGSQLRLKSDSGDSGVGTTGSTPLLFLISNGEVARFDTSGNLGINTTSPNAKLEIKAASASQRQLQLTHFNSTDGWYFTADDTGGVLKTSRQGSSGLNGEAMRIDTSGNLCVGATTTIASERLNLTNGGTSLGMYVKYTTAPNGNGNEFIYCGDSSSVRAYIKSNGGFGNYSANNTNLSDAREKKNIELSGNYLDKICQIPVKTFLYNDQTDTDLNLGAIAQDVQAVAPELVSESDWSTEKDGSKMRLSIYQTDLQYALMKCIQEQQALITSLTARIAALEGTPA